MLSWGTHLGRDACCDTCERVHGVNCCVSSPEATAVSLTVCRGL